VPAGVSAEVVLTRAAAARPRRPDCCQLESGVPTPEGSTGGPMKAKLRAGQKTAGGHSPRTPRGETPQGGKHHTTRGEQHTGKPTRQHIPSFYIDINLNTWKGFGLRVHPNAVWESNTGLAVGLCKLFVRI